MRTSFTEVLPAYLFEPDPDIPGARRPKKALADHVKSRTKMVEAAEKLIFTLMDKDEVPVLVNEGKAKTAFGQDEGFTVLLFFTNRRFYTFHLRKDLLMKMSVKVGIAEYREMTLKKAGLPASECLDGKYRLATDKPTSRDGIRLWIMSQADATAIADVMNTYGGNVTIEKYMTEEKRQAIEEEKRRTEAAKQAARTPVEQPPQPAPAQTEMGKLLRDLQRLRDEGILTEEEFQQKKKAVLDKI